jgi:hypothetical protein
MEPDWHQLQCIAAEVTLESSKSGWNQAKWEGYLKRAEVATNGNPQLTEFMANYLPTD